MCQQVFPRLNACGEPRMLRFLYCDLRWGIPNDATLDVAIRLCLEEIDECKAAHAQPYFIGMLSERYGNVPGADRVPESILEQFDWCGPS